MFYIGIDLSLTDTGIVVLDDNAKIVDQYSISTLSKDQIEKRHVIIKTSIKNIIEKFQPNRINIEGLSFGSRGQSMLDLAGLHFVIRNFLYENNIFFEVIPPTTLKKFATGKGNVKKNLMLLYAYKTYGIEFQNDNICDAFFLARKCLEDNK